MCSSEVELMALERSYTVWPCPGRIACTSLPEVPQEPKGTSLSSCASGTPCSIPKLTHSRLYPSASKYVSPFTSSLLLPWKVSPHFSKENPTYVFHPAYLLFLPSLPTPHPRPAPGFSIPFLFKDTVLLGRASLSP
jgi:hypothetical protein